MQVHSSIREVAVLQAASEMVLSSTDADSVLHQILLIVRNHFGISHCSILKLDPATNELFTCAHIGYDEQQIAAVRFRVGRDGVIGHVGQTRVPLYVPDARQETRYMAFDPRMRSEICLPLVVRDELIGVLDLESDQVDHFTDDMIGLLALFAGQAAVAMENARLYASERRRMRQVEFVNLIARSSNSASSIDQLLGTLGDVLGDTFEGAQVAILLRDPLGNLTVTAFTGGLQPDPLPFRDAARDGIIAEALAARMNVVASYPPGKTPCFPGSGSELAVPLLSLGETLGAIVLSHPRPTAFPADDRSIAQAMADVCATALRNVQLADDLRRMANTDALTGLYNQRYFHVAVAQELARAKRFGKPFSVAMLDLRGFRALNAEQGFAAGDEILRQLGHRLAATVRAIDTLCRFAGDRFAVILPEVGPGQTAPIHAKILKTIAEIHQPQATEPARTATVHYPDDGTSELELVRHLLQRLEAQKNDAARANA